MFKWLKGLLFGKDLIEILDATKTVRVHGVKFVIKKINIANYADGSKVLLQHHDTYKVGNATPPPTNEKKMQEHFSHVLVAGLVEPKLSHKDDGDGIFVDKLFTDWDLVVSLYTAIVEFTYGKKKIGQNPTQRNA